MKAVIEFFYGVGFSGILLQIVPGVPDYISYSMIVFGLATAIVAQWRQSIKDREKYREDVKEFRESVDKNNLTNELILRQMIKHNAQHESGKYHADGADGLE